MDSFDQLVADAQEHRPDQANKDDADLLREACERHLSDIYEPLAEPISKQLGDRYAALVKTFIAWCKELPVSAIPTDPVFLAQFLHERRLAGDDQDAIGAYADAIARANNVVGWADPTGYQLTLSCDCNLKGEKLK